MCKFPNHCNHKPEEFYATTKVRGKDCDLYFFYSKAHRGYEYCLRFGEYGDYSSFPVAEIFKFIKEGMGVEKDFIIIEAFIDHMNKKYQNEMG